jgi:hypothetical protein
MIMIDMNYNCKKCAFGCMSEILLKRHIEDKHNKVVVKEDKKDVKNTNKKA